MSSAEVPWLCHKAFLGFTTHSTHTCIYTWVTLHGFVSSSLNSWISLLMMQDVASFTGPVSACVGAFETIEAHIKSQANADLLMKFSYFHFSGNAAAQLFGPDGCGVHRFISTWLVTQNMSSAFVFAFFAPKHQMYVDLWLSSHESRCWGSKVDRCRQLSRQYQKTSTLALKFHKPCVLPDLTQDVSITVFGGTYFFFACLFLCCFVTLFEHAQAKFNSWHLKLNGWKCTVAVLRALSLFLLLLQCLSLSLKTYFHNETKAASAGNCWRY